MATCIRCGKPCAEGETMCDDCKAWFREKTGGAVPGAGRKAASGKNTIQDSAPASEKKAAKPSAPAKQEKAEKNAGPAKPVNMKIVGIVGAAAAIVLIAVVCLVIFGNKNQGADNPGASESADTAGEPDSSDPVDVLYDEAGEDETEKEDAEQEAETENADDTEESTDHTGEAAVNMDEQVSQLREIYSSQTKAYADSSAFETVSTEDCNLYYLDGELVEIDVANNAETGGYSREYHFENGVLYYANIYKYNGSTNQLYFDQETLIRWKDADDVNHDAEFDSNAYNDWYEYQQEGYEYYALYEDIQSVKSENEGSEYVLPDSDKKYLTKSDLQDLSAWELKLARNEIYARHGRKFNDEQLQDYFNSRSWYKGTVNPDDFSVSVFNAYEKANAEFIASYEKQMGYT